MNNVIFKYFNITIKIVLVITILFALVFVVYNMGQKYYEKYPNTLEENNSKIMRTSIYQDEMTELISLLDNKNIDSKVEASFNIIMGSVTFFVVSIFGIFSYFLLNINRDEVIKYKYSNINIKKGYMLIFVNAILFLLTVALAIFISHFIMETNLINIVGDQLLELSNKGLLIFSLIIILVFITFYVFVKIVRSVE